MAIIWDSTPATASNGWAFRVGYEYSRSPSTITASTSSVVETVRIWVGTSMAVQDPISVSWSGSFGSGSATPTLNHTSLTKWSSSNQTLVKTLTRTVSPSYTSTTATSWSAAASGVYGVPGTSTVSGSAAVPKRPVSAPAAPTGVKSVRVSDVQHTISFVLPAADPARPVTNVLVQRWSDLDPTYRTTATLGSVSSYVDRSTTAGRRYRWRVATKNSAGQSAWVYTDYLYTTPAPPTSVKAIRQGLDVLVSWVKSVSPHNRTRLAWRQEGGAWQYPGWTSTGTSYVIKSPDPSLPLQYAVLAEVDTQGKTLTSTWVYSPLVQLLAPPAAPTSLSPELADAALPITLSWRHNTVDSSEQSAREIRWRPAGTSAWNGIPKAAAADTTHVVPVGLWEPGTVEWQVRTWGAHGDPSGWSEQQLTRVAEAPSVTITSLQDGPLAASQARIIFEFFDPEGDEQAAGSVQILDDEGSIIYQRTWEHSSKGLTPPTRLQDGRSYVIRVRARAASGLWSEWDQVTLDVDYAPPPTGVLATRWDQAAGAVVVTITHPDPSPDEVPGEACALERATLGGEWVRVATDLPLDTSVVDLIPPVGAVVHYRVTTISALPSTAVSSPVALEVPGRGWIYLNGGPGWARMVRLRDNARLGRKFDARKELFEVAGRPWPISIQHEGRSKSIDVSVSTDPRSGGATYAELEAFLDEVPDPICYRDATGDRFFCSISGVSGGRHGRFAEDAAFTVTRVDHVE